jgi:hypothetical protein
VKLIKIAVLLFILNGGLVALVHEIASRAPDVSPFAQLFRAADGSLCDAPCLLGVYVGTTHYTDVRVVYTAHPITHGADIQLGEDTLQAVKHTGNNIFTATCCGIDSTVREMSWFGTALVSPYRTADAILRLGRPDCMEDVGGSYRLYYPRAHIAMIVVRANRQRLTPDDPITLIVVYAQNTTPPCASRVSEPWRGFRATARRVIFGP